MALLQLLVEAGFFSELTSRRLVIINECSDSKIQQNILEVLTNAQREYRLPLMFLFSSRPEKHISLTFSTRVLPNVTTRIVLDESYLANEDIELSDEFQSTHWLRPYIPRELPLCIL